MDEHKPSTEAGGDGDSPSLQRTSPLSQGDSVSPSRISEQDWPEADWIQDDPWGTREWRSPVKRQNPSPKRSGDGAKSKSPGKSPPSEGTRCKLGSRTGTSSISVQNWPEASASGTQQRHSPTKRSAPSPKRGSDGDKPKSPGKLLASKRSIRKWPSSISERDWLEAGASGTQQKHSSTKRFKSSAKPSSDGNKPKTEGTLQSPRTAHSKRPSWISEQDWLEAGPSGTKQGSSQVKRSARGHTPTKTSRKQQKTTPASPIASVFPRRRLKYTEDFFGQCEPVADPGICGVDKEDWKDHAMPAAEDPVEGGQRQPLEPDPADFFSRAFDEVARLGLESQDLLASWCAALCDDDQPSGDDPSS